MKHSLQKGFTLIELLVVIAIIAILSAIVITSLAPAQRKAKVAAFQAEVRGAAPDFVIRCDDIAGTTNALTLPATTDYKNVNWATASVPAATNRCNDGLGTFVVSGIQAKAFSLLECSATITNGNVTYGGSECS